MPLDPSAEKRIRAEAEKRGQDPDAAVARAEEVSASRGTGPPASKSKAAPEDGATTGTGQILVGFLPFVFVKEVRAYMGLTAPFPDEDLPTGDYLAKHGAAPTPSTESPA